MDQSGDDLKQPNYQAPTRLSPTDPGQQGGQPAARPTYRSPVWLWVLTIGALAAVVFMQRPEAPKPELQAEAVAGLNIEPPGPDPVVITTKMLLAMRTLSPGVEVPIQQMADQMVGWSPGNQSLPVSATNPPVARKNPYPAADRLRAAILASESLSAGEVAWRLDDVEKTLAKESELHEDLKIVRALNGIGPRPVPQEGEDRGDDADASYTEVPKVLPTDLESAAVEGFKKRHGMFADLALTKGQSNAGTREKAASDGLILLTVIFLAMCGFGVAGLTGFVLAIVGLINHRSLSPRFKKPHPDTEFPAGEIGPGGHAQGPGSLWLETVCVFVLSFLGLKLVMAGLEYTLSPQAWMNYVSLGLQAASALTIFWPIARGMSFERWKKEIGWAAPRGVVREMGAGVAAYLVGIPIYFGMAMIVVFVSLIWTHLTGEEPPVPEGNRITEILGAGGPITLLMVFLMATVWAPVVEESIFRGALFRHVRRRTGFLLAGLVSAAVFAGLHGYVLQGLIMVGTLGFIFAIMREWRGSIIPSATAHCLHNAVVMCLIGIIMHLASPT